MIKYTLTLLSAMFFSASAFALSCANGDAGDCVSASDSAADCEALGYSKEPVFGCKHYLKCPMNTSYRVCLEKKTLQLTVCEGNKIPIAECYAKGGNPSNATLGQECVNCRYPATLEEPDCTSQCRYLDEVLNTGELSCDNFREDVIGACSCVEEVKATFTSICACEQECNALEKLMASPSPDCDLLSQYTGTICACEEHVTGFETWKKQHCGRNQTVF